MLAFLCQYIRRVSLQSRCEQLQELCVDRGACFMAMLPVYEACGININETCNINIKELCANQCVEDFPRDPSNIDITLRIITDCAEVCNKT